MPSLLLCCVYATLSCLHLFAVCKIAQACICHGKANFCALIWLIGYLQLHPYYAIKFFPDTISNPVYNICRQHHISHSDLTDRIDASWQDCPDTGCSTVGYMIFHKEKRQHQKSNTRYYIPCRPAMNHGPWTKRMCKPSRK